MTIKKKHLNRREVLKGIGIGMVGVVLGKGSLCLGSDSTGAGDKSEGEHRLYERRAGASRVSLVKGNERREIVYQSLKMIEDEVIGSIGDKQILVKPNMVTTRRPLCATHVDAIRAILDFLKPHYKKQIVVGESSAFGNTLDGFKNYGYLALKKEYNVKLVDLNQQPYRYRYVFGKGNRPLPVRIISTFLDPNTYIISAARMKTHDRVVTTLSLKNVLLGSPVSDDRGNDKRLTHTGQRGVNTILHYNMFHLAQEIYPDLAVIDGFEGMEGNGPIWGTSFDSRVAVASRDALAADTIATKVMGFDPKRILYLSAIAEAGMGQGQIEKINVLGTELNQCLYHFKPEERMAEVYNF